MSLKQEFLRRPFGGYCYSYPHKTAYRRLPPMPLRRVWRDEQRDALFLYIHVPFCAGSCGYCNLLSMPGAGTDLMQRFLAALRRQAEAVRENLGRFSVVRMAVGGGTPSLLVPAQLDALFAMTGQVLGVDLQRVQTSLELSPATTSPERLAMARRNLTHRVSIGVQSFFSEELRALGRGQSPRQIASALKLLAEAAFPVFNIDLIYGIPGQTVETFLSSIQLALEYSPSELYLYPLYIRKLTGLAARGAEVSPLGLAMYRRGREFLLSKGFEQVSFRHFRRPRAGDAGPGMPEYSCQSDGMIGLGCGARSYTGRLHYSGEYAVGKKKIAAIIEDYCRKSVADFSVVDYGARLNADERRRRFLLKSLLLGEGLNQTLYHNEFGTEPLADFPQLTSLKQEGLARIDARGICLTEQGLELSDRIGPWLYSPYMRRLMEEYQWQ